MNDVEIDYSLSIEKPDMYFSMLGYFFILSKLQTHIKCKIIY
ncbi:hypothetical protein BH10BAC5_BH10BAC5_10500 [soil metagenome]